MKIGRARTRLALQRPTETVAASGAVTKGWATQGTVWAEIRGLRGQEALQGQQVQATLTHTIRIRYSSLTATIDPTWRGQAGGRTFDFQAVIDVDDRHQVIEIQARERTTP